MDKNEDTRERNDLDDDPERAPGDVLGLSRVSAADMGRRLPDDEEHDDNAHEPPEADERGHVGSRDVTEGTTGGTGPDTGGTGVFRRGSGATGTDIGR